MDSLRYLVALSSYVPSCALLDLSDDEITRYDGPRFVATDIDSLNLDWQTAKDDCGPGSIWKILQTARENALLAIETDILTGFSLNRREKLQNFAGEIGQRSGRGYKNVANGTTLTTVIQTREMPGAALTLRGLSLNINQSADVVVTFSEMAEPLLFVCTAGQFTAITFADPLIIPLDGRKITISYQVNNFQPLDNLLNCSCSLVQKTIGTYLPDIADEAANGFILAASGVCNQFDSVYRQIEARPVIYNVLATALRYKILEFAIEKILSSGEISRYTMMETEALYGKRNNYRKEYTDRITYLCTDSNGLNTNDSACFHKLPSYKMSVTTI